MNAIDYKDEKYLNTPLWCVFGYDCFPSIIACKLTKHYISGYKNGEYTAIWGYSVYKKEPGYRTIGQDVETFLKPHELVKFFDKQEDAIMFISKLVTPKQ